MYDYKGMALFVAVVDLGSMQAAAEKFEMTPSAVTQALQKLESSLNIKLLNRTTRKLSLTDAGEAFYQHASQLAKNAESALKSLELLRSRPVGSLHITCPTGLADSLLMNAFQNVLAEHPELQLNLSFKDESVDLLEERVDIALRAGSRSLNDTMIARHLYDFAFGIVAHRDYFAKRALPTTLAELAALDWIDFCSRGQQLTFQRESEVQWINPNYRVNCNTLFACRRVTMSGLGVSMQPLEDVKELLASGELIHLLPEWKLPAIPLYLVTLQRVQSEKVRVACELIQTYFKGLT